LRTPDQPTIEKKLRLAPEAIPQDPKPEKMAAQSGFHSIGDDEQKTEDDSGQHGYMPVSTSYRPDTGRRLGFFAIGFAVVLAAGFFVIYHVRSRDAEALDAATTAEADHPPAVQVVNVESAAPVDTLTLPGEVRGWYASALYARVSGYVGNWVSDIGDHVAKGQVMATLETPDLDSQLDAAKQALKVADAEVKVREADADFAKTTYDRWQGSPKGVVSDQEREEKKSQYAVSIAQLNAARAAVSQKQSDVDRLTFLTEFKKVTAPYDGVVTARHIDVGDLVSTGNTLLYGVAQYDQVRVFVNVPQSASSDIGVGTEVQVTVSEVPNRVFKGKVTRTSNSLDPRARTLSTEIDLENNDHVLLPGMYVQVAFHLNSANFVQVPAAAMLFRPNGPQVAVVDKDDKVKFQDVTIGRDDGNFIEIASGLSEGERVALNISSEITDGEHVTVNEADHTASR
jgi:RND family efflux transporter MFP subunit